jgi:ABC-2 type transport system permease protein
MKKLLYIAWNDVLIEFSTPWTLVFFLLLPLVFTFIIGAALSNMYGADDSQADKRFVVLVVDEDNSVLSAELGVVLEASEVIQPEFKSLDEAERMLEERDVFADVHAAALLIIPAGFGQTLLAGQQVELALRKVPNDNRVLAVEQAVDAAATQVSNAVAAALASVAEADRIRPFASEADRQVYFQQGLIMAREILEDPPARVETTLAEGAASEVGAEIPSGFEQSSAGQLVTWTLITLVGASEVFVNERLGGTLRRLFVTPTSKSTVLSGKITGRLGMGLVQMAILIGFGALLFDVNWGQSLLALVLVALAFALAAVAFGVMLGTFSKTRGQASGLTILSSMLMAALGGAWWPLEVTPQIYQMVVKILPTTWAMMAFNDIIVRGAGVADVLPSVAVLLGFALLFFVIGIWRFRYE